MLLNIRAITDASSANDHSSERRILQRIFVRTRISGTWRKDLLKLQLPLVSKKECDFSIQFCFSFIIFKVPNSFKYLGYCLKFSLRSRDIYRASSVCTLYINLLMTAATEYFLFLRIYFQSF